jgi:demethylmenaquinone methyltransferase/2-methoxy-6-polyprenyl-1,4-benzoquinol methylase
MKAREYQGPDSQAVQQMFAGIAHRYDFLNHFLSVSTDRYWRRAAVHKMRGLIETPASALCLDACSGTGDLALALHRRLGSKVIASDFCHPMLARASAKFAASGAIGRIENVEGDALALPFADSAFDAVTIAFGLRNLESPVQGLHELFRVLKTGGALVILEFSRPMIPGLRHVFDLYFRYVLPQLGAAISGDGMAYQYLPDSVRRFPAQVELVELLDTVGFRNVAYRNLTGGIAALHWGQK